MTTFKQYRRTQIAEMRPVTASDIQRYRESGNLHIYSKYGEKITVSISQADLENGSPMIGDMIARNPKNHNDLWLVSEEYFDDNFEELP